MMETAGKRSQCDSARCTTYPGCVYLTHLQDVADFSSHRVVKITKQKIELRISICLLAFSFSSYTVHKVSAELPTFSAVESAYTSSIMATTTATVPPQDSTKDASHPSKPSAETSSASASATGPKNYREMFDARAAQAAHTKCE